MRLTEPERLAIEKMTKADPVVTIRRLVKNAPRYFEGHRVYFKKYRERRKGAPQSPGALTLQLCERDGANCRHCPWEPFEKTTIRGGITVEIDMIDVEPECSQDDDEEVFYGDEEYFWVITLRRCRGKRKGKS